MTRTTLKTQLAACLIGAIAVTSCAAPPTSLAPGQLETLVDRSGVAIGGYDPVEYFTSGEPRPGSEEWEASHAGATYRFVSEENRELFVADPGRFAPAYGGWCAWALADGDGSLVEIDPRSFLVQDGRLLLFYDGWLADTRKLWLERDVTELARAGDQNWQRIAGN
ncbi:MAG: YHS domain-containing (seleno)protein [Planctomycetota bacterium]